jgi:hypothetical protein
MTTHAFANPFRPFNPFIAPADDTVDVADLEVADAREVSYALVPSGPAVPADEVESHLDAIEVKVRWGTQVLALAHLASGKGFAIGEGGDFVLPTAERTAIVESRMGAAYAVVPLGARATVSPKGEHPRALAAGEEVALADGMTVTIDFEPVTIEISSVRAGKKTPVGFLAALASGAVACIGLSFVGHAAIVASLAMFMPKMNADDADNISREQILKMQTMLNAAAEREQEQIKDQETSSDPTGGGSTGGEPHKGDSGEAGTTKPVTTQGHMAFKGSDDSVRLSKKDELALAAEGGFVGILLAGAPKNGPTSPWAEDTQLGQDAENKIGAMFGATADDAMGYGLGLWGTGEGGGGKGLGIGIDGVGSTIGGGGGRPGKWGIGLGDKDGVGNGHGPGRGGHVAKAPNLRPPPTIETNGRLPPEVIQRIVRQNFGRFRLCYEAGLRSNPGLSGRVVTRFVIGRDGAVAQAADAGSDLPNQDVVSCVVRSYGNLSFPQPEGGIATVVYPIALSPGE